MRWVLRHGLLILSWGFLLLLVGTSVLLAIADQYGWARQTYTRYRADDGIHYDSIEYRITPTRVQRVVGTQISTKSYLDWVSKRGGRSPQTGPAPGRIDRWVNQGLDLPTIVGAGTPRPQRPDRTTGYPDVGIAVDTQYREMLNNTDVWMTFQSRTQYCWTIWPALLLLAISLPALRQIWRTIAFVCRARRNQKAHLKGICPGCGYDIRATPERCPECGRTQYATDKERLSFVRRMTWLIGLGLLLPAITMVGVAWLWQNLQPDSHLRDGIFYPAMRLFFSMYALGILLWAVRHFILDLRKLIRVYGK